MKRILLIAVLSILLMGCIFTREIVVKKDVVTLVKVSLYLQNGMYMYRLIWMGGHTHVTYTETVASMYPLHYELGQTKEVLIR